MDKWFKMLKLLQGYKTTPTYKLCLIELFVCHFRLPIHRGWVNQYFKTY